MCHANDKGDYRKMNILYYLHQFPAIGGIETVTVVLSNYFVLQGHNVTIVSHIEKGLLGSGQTLDPRVIVLHMPDIDRVSPRNIAFLQATIRDRKIDVVVFQDSYAQIEANLFVDDLKVPVVTCEHSAPYVGVVRLGYYAGFKGRLRMLFRPYIEWRHLMRERRRRRFLYDQSAKYVLLSNRFFGEFRVITGLIDIRKLTAIPNASSCASNIDCSNKNNEIVFIGTLDYLKGCDMLIADWKLLADKHSEWSLTIVGDGIECTRLRSLAEGARNITFVGYQSNPQPYFARAKIFAFPSRREGWGLVLVEAMANGCVPVAFDSFGAVHDIIDEGRNGIIVPAFDLDCYAAALKSLMANPDKLSAMQSAAKAKITEFTIEKVAAKWETMFSEIVKGDLCRV